MILNFICGCNHEIHVNDMEDVGWWKEVSTDREGFLVCAQHRLRRKNWASLPEGRSRQVSDWEFAKFSALQIEQFIVFGKPLVSPSLPLDEDAVEDRRDTRDPEQVGREILAAHSVGGNGHAS